ncbi:MAG: hypothetical protein N3C62_04375 [Synergistetes bacterium]|nr:hypothetical protein [Synergistota bacterium]MCX8127949.1 hypothetical protein [Synergistota bacterium]MDW8192010.1 hypothetical protein [Synergistota bacterium]
MLRIDSFIENPILYYRLDPGEMGLAIPARASESILRVSSHEVANIRRFEAEAAQREGVVIYKNVSLDLAFEGSFLAARAGKSEVRVIYKKSGGRIVLERIEDPDVNRERMKFSLERKKELLEQRKKAIRRDTSLDLDQKEFKIRNLERRIKEIERLIALLDTKLGVPFMGAIFLNFMV